MRVPWPPRPAVYGMPHWIVSGTRLLQFQRTSLGCLSRACPLASSAVGRDRRPRFWWDSRMGNEMGSDSEVDQLADQIGELLNFGRPRSKKDKEDKEGGLELFANWIETGKVKKILVLCGAGVSVSAGIPDFRTPGTGLYDNLQKYSLPYPEAIFQVNFYRQSPHAFVTLAHELWPGLKHSPTLTHSFLKLLSDKGLLLRNYTQNIDGLEHLAGLPPEQLVECHGHFRSASCIDCGKAAPALDVQKTIVHAKEVPLCTKCGGHVKPDIVFFGEQLPDRFYKLLQDDVAKADCMLILGTSLQVAPVSTIPQMVNCPRVLFNREHVLPRTNNKKNKKSSKINKDIFVKGDCDVAVEQLCELLGWTEQLKIQNKQTQIGTTETTPASNNNVSAIKQG